MAYNNENLNLLSTSKSGSLGSQIGGATKPGQFNAQNFASTLRNGDRTLASTPTPTTTQSSSTKPQTYGSAATGYFNTYQEAVNAANNFDPTVNPASVNVNIDDVIDSSALNGTPSVTNAEQNRRQRENNVLKFKYEKESEALMDEIQKFLPGYADLQAEQAKEAFDLKQNPEGVFGPGTLTSMQGRLSEEQAIELNARTGQLNAMMDQFELYEGYRPEMVGSPQIDDATGEAFVYMRDPTTGEIGVESLGQVMEPAAADSGFGTISQGSSIYDKTTGQIIGQAPGGSGSGGGYGSNNPAVQQYADLLAKGQITVSNVPTSIRNAVVVAAGGNVNKALSGIEIRDLAELQTGLDNLADLKKTIDADPDKLGPISGWARLNPWSESKKLQAKILAVKQFVGKALEGGVLRKEDEEKYKKILPTMNDTYATATSKMDELSLMIQRDMENYQNGLRGSSRYVPGEAQGSETRPSLDDIEAKY